MFPAPMNPMVCDARMDKASAFRVARTGPFSRVRLVVARVGNTIVPAHVQSRGATNVDRGDASSRTCDRDSGSQGAGSVAQGGNEVVARRARPGEMAAP